MNIFKKSHYESDSSTIKEFVEYTKWYKEHNPHGLDEDIVKAYLKEKDIALTDIRRLEGANTRNATAELWFAIGGGVGGILLGILLFFSGFFNKVIFFSY
jgi:hypothetical protein